MRQSNLLFLEDSHRYVLADQPDLELVSVTQLVKSYSRPFDELGMATKVAMKRGVDVSVVLGEWHRKREAAATLGTRVHAEAERVATRIDTYRCMPSRLDNRVEDLCMSSYYLAVHKFFRGHPELCYHRCRPEVRVASAVHRLAGSVDLVCHLDGIPSIVDFKTSEKLDLFGFGKNMYAPFNKLPDSNYWHYAVQLNLYAAMLREVYGFFAEQLNIVWLLPSGQFRIVCIPDLSAQVKDMLGRRARKRTRDARKAAMDH